MSEQTEKSIAFKPYGDQLLILPDPAEKVTGSGIILTSDAAGKPNRGRVVALGDVSSFYRPDGKLYEFTVKVGDTVYWRYSGSEIEIDGEKYLVMRESDILGYERGQS